MFFSLQCSELSGTLRAPFRGMTDDGTRSDRRRSVLILEAAGVLGVSRRTVYYKIREGRLQTIRTRGGSQRVLWSSIESFLQETQPVTRPAESAEQTPAER